MASGAWWAQWYRLEALGPTALEGQLLPFSGLSPG